MGGDEGVDPGAEGGIAEIGGPHRDRGDRAVRGHDSRSRSASTTWSVRPHSWDLNNFSSLGRIAESRL